MEQACSVYVEGRPAFLYVDAAEATMTDAQTTSTARKCPDCESTDVVDTGMGSGEISSTYARFTYRYKCQRCGRWFTVTREYDKTKANQRSEDALRQAQEG
jgi:transposase-like protein